MEQQLEEQKRIEVQLEEEQRILEEQLEEKKRREYEEWFRSQEREAFEYSASVEYQHQERTTLQTSVHRTQAEEKSWTTSSAASTAAIPQQQLLNGHLEEEDRSLAELAHQTDTNLQLNTHRQSGRLA
jgi:hypothetical protein